MPVKDFLRWILESYEAIVDLGEVEHEKRRWYDSCSILIPQSLSFLHKAAPAGLKD